MKVAYLLVTTAWLTGAQVPGATGGAPKIDAVPIQTPQTVAPIAPTTMPYGGDCGCNSCSSCDSCGGGFFSKCKEGFGKLFKKHGCGCDTCQAPACTSCQAAPACSSCNTCDTGCGGGFFSKCKEGFGKLFHKHGCDACDSCGSCGGCGSNYGTYGTPGAVIVPKGAETIPPPKEDPAKKMPGGPQNKQVQIDPASPAPLPTPALEQAPTAPAITPVRPGDDRPF